MSVDSLAISSLCPDVDVEAIETHLKRVESDYLQQFGATEIAGHIRKLLGLSDQTPAGLVLRDHGDGLIECTVLAFDHPFEFSVITGVLAGTGFSIESSDVFTLARVSRPPGRRSPPSHERHRDALKDPVILDVFRGRLLGPYRTFDQWAQAFEPAIVEVLRLLDRGDAESAESAKRLVNERVTQWLNARRSADPTSPSLYPTLRAGDIAIEQAGGRTRLHIRAHDAPGFLYALSTALSLHGLSIQRMRIRTLDGQAVDEIEFVDASRQPLVDTAALEQVKLSVLLTQQFAYFLDRSPDPFTALARFERLAEQVIQLPKRTQWVELLSNPVAMSDLAKVLGASDYLWEDFIRIHADSLLPILTPHVHGRAICPSTRSLPRRLEEALRDARTLVGQQERMNEFKERELFLIDLDHILWAGEPDAAFAVLSDRLVSLAENLVAAAVRLAYADLIRQYGQPLDEEGQPATYAVFGLGKLGGVALGYASDIELLFIYSAPGWTAGAEHESTSNVDLFEKLAQSMSQFIRAKREGIFRVDLRLRPFGGDGPLACSRQQFIDYYKPGGDAHPFETLATVRMRWLAGDAKLGFEVERVRDEFLYDAPMLDLDAIWDIWTKMHIRHARGRELNGKYSSGALSDLETAVQLLQLKHAREAPQLRTPRLHEAIEGLRRAGVISPEEYESLVAAYQFYRRLINATRMLRGSALDLFLPERGTDELLHLVRRMSYEQSADAAAASSLLDDFAAHTAAVREFIQRHFGRECPG